jgi:hypothetical protein
MPDHVGVLSGTEQQKIGDWLRDKNPRLACPLCHSMNWSIGPHSVSPSVVNGSGVGVGAYLYPQAMIISECGYTIYINLFAIGVFPRGEPS